MLKKKKQKKAIEGFCSANKHDYSTLISVFYDPHQADQIVFTHEFLKTEEAKEVHLIAEILGPITNHKSLILSVFPIFISHSLWVCACV